MYILYMCAYTHTHTIDTPALYCWCVCSAAAQHTPAHVLGIRCSMCWAYDGDTNHACGPLHNTELELPCLSGERRPLHCITFKRFGRPSWAASTDYITIECYMYQVLMCWATSNEQVPLNLGPINLHYMQCTSQSRPHAQCVLCVLTVYTVLVMYVCRCM